MRLTTLFPSNSLSDPESEVLLVLSSLVSSFFDFWFFDLGNVSERPPRRSLMEFSGSLRLDENFVERLDRRALLGLILSSASTGSSVGLRLRDDLRGILFC